MLLLLAPIGFGQAEWRRTLENTMHAPLFAGVAVVLAHRLRAGSKDVGARKKAYVGAFAVAAAIGALGEVLQGFAPGRDPEWIDLGNDALGAAGGLAVYALWKETISLRVRAMLYAAAFVAAVVITAPLAIAARHYWQRWRQLPELATWSASAGHHFMRADAADSGVALLPARWERMPGELCYYVSPVAEGQWVGAGVREPWPDWREYSRLSFDLVNPVAQPIALVLRIDDVRHNHEYSDRYNAPLHVAGESRVTLKVNLDAIRRAPASRLMDMSSIALVLLFQERARGAQPFYLCGLRLERG